MSNYNILNKIDKYYLDKKGGVLLSTLYAYSIHGDPFKSSLLKSGLIKVIQSIICLLKIF